MHHGASHIGTLLADYAEDHAKFKTFIQQNETGRMKAAQFA